eukprot:COSAG04_NODE_1177_length_7916_cov_13.807599_7_plen_79_part_01
MAQAAFLASIDVVVLEFRRLVAQLQGLEQDGAPDAQRQKEHLRRLVAPIRGALRDLVAHAEADGAAAGGAGEGPAAKRR